MVFSTKNRQSTIFEEEYVQFLDRHDIEYERKTMDSRCRRVAAQVRNSRRPWADAHGYLLAPLRG